MPRWLMIACLVFAVAMPVDAGHALRAAEAHKDAEGHGAKGEGTSMEEQGKATLQDWIGGDKAQFYRMPPFNVPVIRDGRPAEQVSLAITVETKGVDKRNKIIEKRTELRSAFLRDLYAVMSLRNGGRRPLNIDTVKIRLKRVADRVLGPGVVDDVLVEGAYTRTFD